MRAIVLVLAAGCVAPPPVIEERVFDARVTYAGVRTEGVVTFMSYRDTSDEPVTIDGAITGEAPITRAALTDAAIVTYAITIARRQDDFDDMHSSIACMFDEADVGHPVACMFSRHACSIVLDPRLVVP